jgi:hypothetical protein
LSRRDVASGPRVKETTAMKRNYVLACALAAMAALVLSPDLRAG